ncbi:MAG: hypothetical protein Q4C26_00375 [Bacteroidales bacterium]|mgnify:FL=1|nr:hypothetical protein [Bacteroidales bacterium]
MTKDLSSIEQLISIYPWYQGARVELILKLAEISKETAREKLRESFSFVPFPEWIATKIEGVENTKKRTENDKVIQSQIQQAKKIFVVGGDYFSREELESVNNENEAKADSPAIPVEAARSLERERAVKRDGANSVVDPLIFYTETLAQIYTQQECWREALDVYSKLILLYPEKSVYFASLVNDIKLKISSSKENNIKNL